MIDVSKLRVGLKAKNYKEFCRLIGEEVKKNNSKKAQLKEWDRYFKYEKQGQSLIITEVYDVPIDIKKIRGLNSKYAKDIQPLILDLLAQKENEGKILLTCNQLFKKLQMVNQNYAKGRSDVPRLSELIKVEEDIIYDFYSYTHSNLRNIVETALNSLEDQSLLKWQKVTMVCEEVVDVALNEVGKPLVVDGVVSYKINKTFRVATDEEISIILRCEKTILNEYKVDSLSKVVSKGLWEDFKNKVNKLMRKSCNILFYYNSYKIISNQDIIELELHKLGRFEKVDRSDSINNMVSESLSKSIKIKYENSKNKVDVFEEWINCGEGKEFSIPNETNYLHAKSDYIEKSEKVKSAVILRKSRGLRFDKDKEK